MTGQNSRPNRHRDIIPLERYLKDLFDQRFVYVEKGIEEAKRLMEKTMAGFPTEYAKKLELEQTALLVKELKDNDLNVLKSSIDKKLSREEYDTRHEVLLQKAIGWEKIESNINGRLWALGILVTGGLVLIEVVFRYIIPTTTVVVK